MFCGRVIWSNCDLKYLFQDIIPINQKISLRHSLYDYVIRFDAGVKNTKETTVKQDSTLIERFAKFEGYTTKFEQGDYCTPTKARCSGLIQFIKDCDAKDLTIKSVS